MNEREQLINTLQATYRTIATQEQWYQKYLDKKTLVENQERLIDNCKASKFGKGVLAYVSVMASAMLILGIGDALFGVLHKDSSVPAFVTPILIVVVVGLAVVAYKLGVKFILAPMAKRKAAPLQTQLARMQQELAQSQKDLNTALTVNEQGSIAPNLSNKYYNTQAVRFMLEAVQGMRADTLKEALNLYEEELHRQKMLQGQRQILKQQQDLKAAVEQAQRSADAAYNAAEHATWAAYNNNR